MWVIAVSGRRSGWVLNAVATTMSAYARSGPRVTADNPLLVQFQPVR